MCLKICMKSIGCTFLCINTPQPGWSWNIQIYNKGLKLFWFYFFVVVQKSPNRNEKKRRKISCVEAEKLFLQCHKTKKNPQGVKSFAGHCSNNNDTKSKTYDFQLLAKIFAEYFCWIFSVLVSPPMYLHHWN